MYLIWDIFIAKLDPLGNLIWVTTYYSLGPDGTQEVVTDENNNIYVTGSYAYTIDFDPGPEVHNLSAIIYDGFILKLNQNGEFVWAHSLGSSGSDQTYSVAVDSDENVIIYGVYEDTIDIDPGPDVHELLPIGNTWTGNDGYILKLNSEGDFIWAQPVLSSSSTRLQLGCLAIDNENNIYLATHFMDTIHPNPEDELFLLESEEAATLVLKLDADGDFIWADAVIGTSPHTQAQILCTEDNDVLLVDSYWGLVDFDFGPEFEYLDAGPWPIVHNYILKMTSDGEFLWVKENSGSGDIRSTDADLDEAGNIYVTGTFDDTIDFDPGMDEYVLIANDLIHHSFTQKLTPNGELVWAAQIGGYGGYAVSAFKENAVYTAGLYAGIADFDHTEAEFTMDGGSHTATFLHKIGDYDYTSLTNIEQRETLLYPNPSCGTFQLKFQNNQNVECLSILDHSGRIVGHFNNPELSQSYSVEEYANGIYFVHVRFTSGKKNSDEVDRC